MSLLPSVADHPRGLRAKLHQFLDGVAGLSPAARLEVPAEQDQRRDDGTGLEVEVRASGSHSPKAVQEGGEHPERDQRVHIGSEIARLHQHAAMKIPPGPEDDDGAQERLDPHAGIAPEIGPGQRDIRHRQQHDRSGEDDRGSRTPASGLHLFAKQLPVIRRVVVKDFIAVVDDGLAESRFGHGGFVELDARSPCAEIDVGLTDTGGLQQGAFVADGAGGAVHAADREGDCCHRRGSVSQL
jgi:hypothetical protein